MIPTVGDVMREVRNYFQHFEVRGEWTISGGVLSPGQMLLPGDWIAVTGSRRNNGVYQLDADMKLPACTYERFEGTVWVLSPPRAFLALCEQIAGWCTVHPAGVVKRESFGGYTRENAVDRQGRPLTWQQRFALELTPYRRMYAGVKFHC